MGVEIKDEFLGTRITKTKAQEIETYMEAKGIRMTEFVREAADEYMANHPIPNAKALRTK